MPNRTLLAFLFTLVPVLGAAQPVPAIADAEYVQVSKRILDRVTSLKKTHPTLQGMKSPVRYEHNVTWVLDDPTKPHSKTNARRAVFGPEGYWFSLQFYRGDWAGAAMFSPVEFGDLKLWFDFGHGGNASVIAAIASIVKEENEAFCKRHAGQCAGKSSRQ